MDENEKAPKKQSIGEREEEILQLWNEKQIFEKYKYWYNTNNQVG